MARMASGRLFQRRGAALENAFSPCVRSLHRGTTAGERPRSVAHGSVRNELVGRLCMMQLVHEGFETSTVTICTRSAV